jgi:DNA invertase Pin-like site-specific DNA recombinase
MIYGYARVSSIGQTLDAQLEQLKAAGCEKIFREKATGRHDGRRELQRMLKALAPGDTVIVTRLDRLARSQRDLLNMLAEFAAKGTGFRSLRDAWADTTTMHGRLMLNILGGLAEFERELIVERTTEGRMRAKERGQHMGRPLPSPRSSRPRPASALRKALRRESLPPATTSGNRRLTGYGAARHDAYASDNFS